MRLVLDFSSLLWTCLLTGKDVEGKEVEDEMGKKHWVNTHMYAYEFAVNSVKSALDTYNLTPIDMILVVEGMNSKAQRLFINKDYKANRGKRPREAYEEFGKLRDLLLETFKSLGAIAVKQDCVEADDMIAWLAQNSRDDMVIMSNDNDLLALAGKNEHGATITARIGGEENYNKYGLFPLQYVTLYKALVGDTGDNIKGITGFGESAWKDFHAQFGEDGMAEMVRLAKLGSLQELEEDAAVNKLVKKIFDGREQFLNSWKLASLHAEWVDTMSEWPIWMPGMVTYRGSDERLRHWGAASRLVTADKWDAFLPWFMSSIQHRDWIALDIETSTPDESDDWLEAQGNPDGVDVIGSELTGMSLTFGSNMQYTVYIPVDHKHTNNVDKKLVRELLEYVQSLGKHIVIQNTSFEATVLYNEFGAEWKDNGYNGLLANWWDSKLEASYVDENDSLGLKHLSKKWLNYDQVDYKTVTTVDGVQHKMRELSAQHVLSYACDDTITTAALHNYFRLFMELEGTWDVYKEVEIDASYLHALAYIEGTRVDLPKLNELVTEDDKSYTVARQKLDEFLISKGWEGSVCPKFTEIDAKAIKLAYEIVTGTQLETTVRTPAKLLAMFEATQPLLHAACASVEDLNALVARHFTAAPTFNGGSPKQMATLLYETLALPVRVYNQPTDAMKKAGAKVGSPKTDALAITYAMLDADETQKPVLECLRAIKVIETRRGLFYNPLPTFVHWKTGKVHSNHNQCGTNTRRASSSRPNLQQLSKHEKVEGFSPRVRELYIPHKKSAVIVSFDFKSQELLLMAEWSQDPTLIACFVGDNLIDMHSKTGVGVHNRLHGTNLVYEEFVEILSTPDNPLYKAAKKSRALAKSVNFGSQYRIAAKKLSTMLLVVEEEAQAMLDAKAAAFPQVESWSQKEMEEIKVTGKTYTMLGAVRHLRDAVLSEDRYEASKAPRQALSFRIQGSAAEMTKLAEGKIFRRRILSKYDARYFAAVHDELVFSVAISDLSNFIPEVYALMTENYAGMSLPVGSSVSIGPDFGRQVELEGDFSSENLTKILQSFGLA
jgi:DNA polymerase I-like protein with 3'-5' exonuclease and polymerase domains/5'-3' exonuclease